MRVNVNKERMKEPIYKRILLKLSGESLAGAAKNGLSPEQLQSYARQIVELQQMGVEIAIVVGGGNIFRGLSGATQGMDRVKGDRMGMLATVINALALSATIEQMGVNTCVMTATPMEPFASYYDSEQARRLLEQGTVVFVAGGTGNPFFTTDTASALRGVELQAHVMLKGTRVDGIYTADPEKDPSARKIDRITYDEIYNRNLRIMDLTATTLCKENNLPIVVFDMDMPGNLLKVLTGEQIGTTVYNSPSDRN